MPSLNKVILIGHLGKDPEVKFLPSGQAMTRFSVATSESWNDKDGGKKEKTEWHKIVMFGKLAEIAGKYLTKGKLVYLEGRIETRDWEQDGVKKYMTEIIANQMKMLSGKGDGNHQAAPDPEPRDQAPMPDTNEDIPF